MLEVEARCFVCAAGESGICLVHAVRCLAPGPANTTAVTKIFELQAVATGYLAGRYFRVLSYRPRDDQMVILRRVLDRKIEVRHSIKWHEVKLPSYSVHACAYNEIEPLLLMFLIKYAQSPSRGEVPPR